MRRTFVWSLALLLAAAIVALPQGLAGDKDKKDDDKKEEKKDKGKDKKDDKGKDKKDDKGKKDDDKDKKGALLKINGELTDADPMDTVRTTSHAKTYKIKLAEGKTYKIDMTSQQVDSFLRLEDADGKQIAQDDDGGGFPNARIIYKAPQDGSYTIVATTFKPNDTGKFNLTVAEAGPRHLLLSKISNFPGLPAGEQKEILAELTKQMEEKGDKLTVADAQPAMQIAMSLENGPNKDLAARTYKQFGKVLAASSDEKVAQAAKLMEGASRRMSLLGKEMSIKGTTLDGKEFDWAKYKGKVVLVDFWATWCPPCRAEIPNIKKLYKEYNGRGFEVVGISLDRTKDACADYMDDNKMPWVSLFDPEPAKGAPRMTEYYGVFAIPQAILIDRDGKVISLNARGNELDRLLEKHIGPSENPPQKKVDPNRDLQ